MQLLTGKISPRDITNEFEEIDEMPNPEEHCLTQPIGDGQPEAPPIESEKPKGKALKRPTASMKSRTKAMKAAAPMKTMKAMKAAAPMKTMKAMKSAAPMKVKKAKK